MNTMKYTPRTSGARLIALENGKLRFYALDQKQQWLVGRAGKGSAPDIDFQSRVVSRQHGWLMGMDEEWYYVDNPNNLNGTFLNGVAIDRPLSGTRKPITLRDGDVLGISGNGEDEGVAMVYTTRPVGSRWGMHPLNGREVLLGRDPECAICWQEPEISGRHAQLTPVEGSYQLWDFGSRSGTVLNGRTICGAVRLKKLDHFSICGKSCFFLGDRLLYEK